MNADEDTWNIPTRWFPKLRDDLRMILWMCLAFIISIDFPNELFMKLAYVAGYGLWRWYRRLGPLCIQPSGFRFPHGFFARAEEIREISPSPIGWQVAIYRRGLMHFIDVREVDFDDAEWLRVRAAFRAWRNDLQERPD